MTKKLKKQLMELILFAGLILWAVFNYKLFIDFVGFAFKLVMPLIVGVAIAFIINVPMKSIEKNSYILYNNKIKDISSKTAISNLPLKQYKNDYKFQSLFFIEL